MNSRHFASAIWAVSVAVGLAFFLPQPAKAGLQLCNRTSYVLYAAVGVQAGPEIRTQGWTRIVPGACEVAIAQSLTLGPYYVFARSSQAHTGPSRLWTGKTPLCAENTNFALKSQLGAPNCPSENAFFMPFAFLDTRAMRNWTMTFTESPGFAGMDAARAAGLKRLLRDNGYKFAQIDAGPDKASAAALADFRKRMKIAANAESDDLFDALETEAMKIAAPAGYSICNDTDENIWSAVGTKSGSDWISRGWWMVPPGSCARAIATPLSNEAVWLLVQRKGGQALVTGKTRFCITNIQFEIHGRDKCTARGLTDEGFAETRTKGLSGYSAHVSDEGLVAPLSFQAPIPK